MPCDGRSADVSLYIHFPWCARKCPYCDFNSHERKRPIDERRYIDALIRDLDRSMESVGERTLGSVSWEEARRACSPAGPSAA